MAFENLPCEMLVRIAGHLHWRDVYTLECVNKYVRFALIHHFWPSVRTLAFHYYEDGRQPNPLSVARSLEAMFEREQGEEAVTEMHKIFMLRTTSDDVCELLRSCAGGALRRLDLDFERFSSNNAALWRNLIGRYHDRMLQNRMRNPHFWAPIDGDRVCAELTRQHSFPVLEQLDLSHIPISTQALAQLALMYGHNLKSIRLSDCFGWTLDEHGEVHEESKTEEQQSRVKEDWKNFLACCSRLQHLDISSPLECRFDWHLFTFAHISTHLRVLNTLGSGLSAYQLAKVVERTPNLRELSCSLHRWDQTRDRFDDVQRLFARLNNIEVLWVEKRHCWNDPREEFVNIPIQLSPSTSNRLRRLRTLGGTCCYTSFASELLSGLVNGATQLEEAYIVGESAYADDAPLLGPYLPMLATCTRLCLAKCLELDDATLARIAYAGDVLQELTVLFCQDVTWRGLAVFLDTCENLRCLEGAEQMTDELLAATWATIDRRRKCAGATSAAQTSLTPLFYFLRVCFQPEPGEESPPKRLLRFRNSSCLQSASQCLHPGVVFAREQIEDNERWHFRWQEMLPAPEKISTNKMV